MSKLTAAIPFSQIAKIKIYINSGRKSMAKIKRDLGCDYLINAGLFNMKTFRPVNRLVANGKTLASAPGMIGMSFSDAHAALSYENQVKYPEHVSGYPCLLKSGKKAWTAVPAGLEGRRGRSAIGYGTHAVVLLCCSDGANALTLHDLTAEMRRLGCVDAINLDGGGSSQCDFVGKQIKSSRIVHNYIAIWCKRDTKTKTVSVRTALNIRQGAPNALGINTSKVVGTYSNGQRVTVYESRAGWCRTDRGWVCGLYLR